MRKFLMLSALIGLTAVSASGSDQLRIAVSPAMAFAPLNLNIRARVVPNPENRALEVVAQSSDFYRSSQVQLEGENAPATITFQFRGLPGGDYVVSGVLIDSAGRRRAIDQRGVTALAPSH